MQLIHELSWLWKGIAIIALVSAIVLIAAFKLHKEEYKIEIACIILIVTILICIIAMILCAWVPMPISSHDPATEVTGFAKRAQILGMLARVH